MAEIITAKICWSGTESTLDYVMSEAVKRVTNGRYDKGRVVKVSTTQFQCGQDPVYRYHREVLIEVGGDV